MGSGAADIAEVVSEVRERLPDLEPSPELESPEAARFRLFDSITSFLKSAAQRQPLVVVLDDMHWADETSLLLLQFLSRELGNARLMVLGTYRDMELSRQHPLAETLGELTRSASGGFQRMLLRGLTPEDVGSFIELTSGLLPPGGLVEAVHTQTEGNPLFVTEVVRLLVQEGELGQERENWDVRIPEGVREVIGRRLNRLSARCNEAMTVAAVLGREFELSHLRPLIEDTTENQLLDTLEEALGSRIIEELPQTVGSYRFTHALIRHTLMDELSTTRRVRLHARIGEALEALYGDDAEAHAAQLAYHFGEAEPLLGSDQLVRYSRLAGERALGAHAHEEALAHFKRALATREGQEMESDTATLLFGLGRAQAAMYMRDDARVSLTRAFDYFAESGDSAEALAVVESLPPGSGLLGMTDITTRALAMAPPTSPQAGRLLNRQGLELGRSQGDYEAAQEAFRQALAIAQREGDVALEMRTSANAADVDGWYLRFEEALENSLRAVALADRVNDLYAESLAQGIASLALSSTGDPEAAGEYAQVGLATAERLRDRYRLVRALHFNVTLSRLTGDWESACASSDRALALVSEDCDHLLQRAAIECELGRFDVGETYLKRLVDFVHRTFADSHERVSYTASGIPVIARITGQTSLFDVARAASETLLSSPFPIGRQAAWVGLAMIAVEEGDVDAAGELYATHELQRGTLGPLFTSPLLANDRVLGLLAHTMGNLDDSAAHFEDALAFCRKAGYRPELAWTCCDYADMLRDRDGPSGQEKAVKLLDESLAISTELGMRPLMERVLARQQMLKA